MPALSPLLPQVVSGDRWILSPSQGLLSPLQVRKLLYEAPGGCRAGCEGTQGRAGLLVVASVFPANMAFAKMFHPMCVVGLPRNQAAANGYKALGMGRSGAS